MKSMTVMMLTAAVLITAGPAAAWRKVILAVPRCLGACCCEPWERLAAKWRRPEWPVSQFPPMVGDGRLGWIDNPADAD